MEYERAEPSTNRTPLMLTTAPSPLLHSSAIPNKATAMHAIVFADIFSLKKKNMMRATVIGYTNKIVEAMPASMWW